MFGSYTRDLGIVFYLVVVLVLLKNSMGKMETRYCSRRWWWLLPTFGKDVHSSAWIDSTSQTFPLSLQKQQEVEVIISQALVSKDSVTCRLLEMGVFFTMVPSPLRLDTSLCSASVSLSNIAFVSS